MTRRRRETGQILVVVLLAIPVLAGLIFYVVNSGDQVNRRVDMQNAADSAAISSAAWMARSMNLLGQNNVAQTRMLALVPILDAFPLSTKMAVEDIAAWEQRLQQQLQVPLPSSERYLKDGLQSLRDRMVKQRQILQPMDEYFNPGGDLGRPITPLTTWYIRGQGGPAPHGRIWQAADALDQFNQATASSAGILSQANAVRYAQASTAELAFVAPVIPTMPAARASFAEYERPVKTGIIPDSSRLMQPPKFHRLGPYDRLYKWRHYQYNDIRERDKLVPGDPGHGAIRNVGSHVGLSGRIRGSSAMGSSSDPNPHWSYRTVGRVLLGYTVYGPYEWMLGRITGYSHGGWNGERGWYAGELGDTYFHDYQRNVSGIKLGYMWGPQAPKYIHYPQWITDFPRARTTAEGGARVARTMFYVVEVRSRYPKGSGGFMSPGSYVTNGKLPIAMWLDGWVNPDDWVKKNPEAVKKIADWIWEDNFTYETTDDAEIGITGHLDGYGQPVWQKVYMVSQYVFGGIDVGGEIEVTNPTNCSDRAQLPAPVMMDLAYGDYDMSQPHHDLGVRWDVFSHLGIASVNNRAKAWPQRFGSGNPFNGVCAVGQAEIFNTTSWDLWTQDWKCKLIPVSRSRWGDWMGKLHDGIGDAGSTDGLVNPDDVQRVQEYLSRFGPELAEDMMHH